MRIPASSYNSQYHFTPTSKSSSAASVAVPTTLPAPPRPQPSLTCTLCRLIDYIGTFWVRRIEECIVLFGRSIKIHTELLLIHSRKRFGQGEYVHHLRSERSVHGSTDSGSPPEVGLIVMILSTGGPSSPVDFSLEWTPLSSLAEPPAVRRPAVALARSLYPHTWRLPLLAAACRCFVRMGEKAENPMRELAVEKLVLNICVGTSGDPLEKARRVLKQLTGLDGSEGQEPVFSKGATRPSPPARARPPPLPRPRSRAAPPNRHGLRIASCRCAAGKWRWAEQP